MKLAKAGAATRTLSEIWAVEGALCHGWIDRQLGRLDSAYFLVRFTPRRTRSRWSEVAAVASVFYLVPTVSAVMAYVFFAESLVPLQIGGMVLAATGVAVANRK